MASTLNLDWIYGTWQINMDIKISPSLSQKIASEYNDTYILNVCVINDTTYYLKLYTGNHGVLPWIGPYIINGSVLDRTPDSNGVIKIATSDITPPPSSQIPSPWPISSISFNDLKSFPVLINTNNPNNDQNGTRVGIQFSVSEIDWSVPFYGIKGCQTLDKSNPYTDCYPTGFDNTSFPLVPALCPIRGDVPFEQVTLPSWVLPTLITVGSLLIIFIIVILVMIFRKK